MKYHVRTHPKRQSEVSQDRRSVQPISNGTNVVVHPDHGRQRPANLGLGRVLRLGRLDLPLIKSLSRIRVKEAHL